MLFSSIEKTSCLLKYAQTNSNKTVQHEFVREFSKKSPKPVQTKNHYHAED